MAKKKNRRSYLEKVARPPELATQTISRDVARQLPIIFGFKNLDLDKKPFNCSSRHGESLLYVLETFAIFSKIIRGQMMITYPNCHLIPDNQIKQHNLTHLVTLAPSSKLHQLGRKRTPQRVIGYFDSPGINLFQVCLLDLNHNLSGD